MGSGDSGNLAGQKPTVPEPEIIKPAPAVAMASSQLQVIAEQIPTSPEAVTQAEKEAQAFADGNLDEIAKKNEHGRREELRDVVHKCSVFLIRAIVATAILGGMIVAYHWLTPEAWHFLSANQLDKLEAVGTSAVFSGLVATYGKKLVEKL